MSGKLKKPPARASAELQLSSASMSATTYRGPIPSGDEMLLYEKASPGLPGRIMTMAENQSAHRQKIELIAIQASSRNSTLGVIFAFILAMTTLLLGGFCIYLNKDVLGSFIGGIGLASIVATFIYGTRSNRAERENKLSTKP
jgi:uncharacterized membrane protein